MDLEAFIGEWSIEAGFEGAPTGTVEFEWMPGGKFVVQRWEVPVPEAPDGLAAIGFTSAGRPTSSTTSARAGRRPGLRDEPRGQGLDPLAHQAGLSPLDFSQRL